MLLLTLTPQNGPDLYYGLDVSGSGNNVALSYDLPTVALETGTLTVTLELTPDLKTFWQKGNVFGGAVVVADETRTWWTGFITQADVNLSDNTISIQSSPIALSRKAPTRRLPKHTVLEVVPDLYDEAQDRNQAVPDLFGTCYGVPPVLASNPEYESNLIYIVAGHSVETTHASLFTDNLFLGTYPIRHQQGPFGDYAYIGVPKTALPNGGGALWIAQVTGRQSNLSDILRQLANDYLPEDTQDWMDLQGISYADQFLKSFSAGVLFNSEIGNADILTTVGQRFSSSFPVQVGYPAGKFSWAYSGVILAPPVEECVTLRYGQDLFSRGALPGMNIDQVSNNFLFTAGFDGGAGADRAQGTLSHKNSAFCRTSKGRWGESAQETINLPDVSDLSTAHLIVEERAARSVRVPTQTSYVTTLSDVAKKPLGSFFAIEDEDWFSGKWLMRLDSISRVDDGTFSLGVTVFSNT